MPRLSVPYICLNNAFIAVPDAVLFSPHYRQITALSLCNKN